jgi:hypothetical protein
MLRVARVGIGVFEGRDSLLLRFATRLGLVTEYELEPAALSGGTHGGVRDSPIPNYIYRWTEREVEKTVNSYLPHSTHDFTYVYGYLVPTQRLAMSPSRWRRLAARVSNLAVPVAEKLLPKQGNQFGVVVTKSVSMKPWLVEKDGNLVADDDYLKRKFKVERYRSPEP